MVLDLISFLLFPFKLIKKKINFILLGMIVFDTQIKDTNYFIDAVAVCKNCYRTLIYIRRKYT
jgi:hypothetical protein